MLTGVLLYADDALICARDAQAAADLLAACDTFCQEIGLRLSPTKCEAMAVNTAPLPLVLHGQPLRYRPSLRYLGVPLRASPTLLRDQLLHRLHTARAWFGKVRRLATLLRIGSPFLRMVLTETLVLSRLYYGAVLWGPLAPSFPVVAPLLFDRQFGAGAIWGAVETFVRDLYRWQLGLTRTDRLPLALLYTLANRPPAVVTVNKAVWRYDHFVHRSIGGPPGAPLFRAARQWWDAVQASDELPRGLSTPAYAAEMHAEIPADGPSTFYRAVRTQLEVLVQGHSRAKAAGTVGVWQGIAKLAFRNEGCVLAWPLGWEGEVPAAVGGVTSLYATGPSYMRILHMRR